MTATKVSIDNYRLAEIEGLLSKRRAEVFRVIARIQPCTYSQVIHEFREARTFESSTTYQARIVELNKLGVIRSLKIESCPITKRQANFWVVTGNFPTEIKTVPTPKPKDTEALRLLKEIQDSVSQAFLGPELTQRIRKVLKQ